MDAAETKTESATAAAAVELSTTTLGRNTAGGDTAGTKIAETELEKASLGEALASRVAVKLRSPSLAVIVDVHSALTVIDAPDRASVDVLDLVT